MIALVSLPKFSWLCYVRIINNMMSYAVMGKIKYAPLQKLHFSDFIVTVVKFVCLDFQTMFHLRKELF